MNYRHVDLNEKTYMYNKVETNACKHTDRKKKGQSNIRKV